MIRISLLHSAALAMALTVAAAPAGAQTMMVAAPNPDADRLTQTMRTLAADPRDLSALVEAGRLSTRLNDTPAALAFFQRAESVSPGDPRIAAGRAAVLVRLKRPGEALRLFQSAEARGASIRDYAADRGFAYDLLGQPGLAQADYKLAMQRERDDELVRRYALSLGISGQVDQANALLDPLLRRSDRAAWRARAFILAMNGDMAGAERIATSMMPGNMAPSLVPFFRRLGGLTPADRAFAVHFGELSPTQARLADARLAPNLPHYVPEQRPVQVAARQAPAPAARTRDRRSARDRRRQEPVVVAAATPVNARLLAAPAPQPMPPPAPAQPVFAQQRTPIVQPLPAPAPTPSPVTAPVVVAMREPAASSAIAPARTPVPTREVVPAPATSAATLPAANPTPTPTPSAPVQLASTTPPIVRSAIVAPSPSTPAASAPAPVVTQPSAATPSLESAAARRPEPAVTPPPVAVVQPSTSPAPAIVETRVAAAAPEPAPPGPVAVGQEDSVLASIVANLTIPAAELEAANSMALPVPTVATVPPPAPPPVEAPEPVKPRAKAEPAKLASARADDASKPAAIKGTKTGKTADTKIKPDAKADAKAKLDAKAKADAKAKPAAKPDPERVWVQVAGGANAGDLAKAWKSVAAKAPAQLRGKSGWWTPVRASNRLLTGPFKTEAEGQAFVNSLAKAGVSGFVFTSEAGQKVNKIGDK
ncbi:SPOR domain-containing protein [Sphingomonas sp. S2-65]|uniref:SPOR domain-containing protein n=1 Tax=Sphingomonas sp. S2-65 TaxID=2903960 RepID=UPI001F469F03|nr:SPOR domain-containing protein [Sphingomonas sp. S2-65]UYY59550.1 SPOR domain-containing protein [Sphingomonas sp. S2-65]